MNIVAIIPARGGSKGIPNKNIMRVAGKPLLAWTVDAAKRSRAFDRIVVSSDAAKILSVAERYGVEVIKRPKKYARDHTPVAAAVTHALDHLKQKEGYVPDVIVLLQPTSPLRTARDIVGAVKLLKDRSVGAVISVTECDNKALKSFFMNGRRLEGIVNNRFPFTNRQRLPHIYMANGALYIIREKEFRKNKGFFSERTVGFLMKKERSIDLDDAKDIPALEDSLKRMKSNYFK